MSDWKGAKFSELLGKTLVRIDVVNDERIDFLTESQVYRQQHDQGCCESVAIEDIAGNLDDLIGSPILLAEEVTFSEENPPGVPVPEYQDSWTWTFYKLATARGAVTIRWYGASNGFYSEAVSLLRRTLRVKP